MMKMADMTDLKSVDPLDRSGSTPDGGTIFCDCSTKECKQARPEIAIYVTKCEHFLCRWCSGFPDGLFKCHTCGSTDPGHFKELENM